MMNGHKDTSEGPINQLNSRCYEKLIKNPMSPYNRAPLIFEKTCLFFQACQV